MKSTGDQGLTRAELLQYCLYGSPEDSVLAATLTRDFQASTEEFAAWISTQPHFEKIENELALALYSVNANQFMEPNAKASYQQTHPKVIELSEIAEQKLSQGAFQEASEHFGLVYGEAFMAGYETAMKKMKEKLPSGEGITGDDGQFAMFQHLVESAKAEILLALLRNRHLLNEAQK